MSSLPLKPEELDQQLKDLDDWEKLANYLPRIGRIDIDIIKRENASTHHRKQALFHRWLRVWSDASWNDVVRALESIDEKNLAQKVRRLSQQRQSADEEDTFLQLVRSLGGKMKYIVVTLHGPPGAGKTSVKRLILGHGPLPKELQNSTNIMNVTRSVCTRRITYGEQLVFKEVTNEQVLAMLAKKVKMQATGLLEVESSMFSSSPPPPSESILPIDPDAEILQQIRTSLENVDPSNELFDLDWIYLIDSGGQPQFSDVLPFLFHHQSLHIVVFCLTDGLSVKPPVHFYQKGQDQYRLPHHLSLTNLEYIERMCEISESVEKSTGYVTSVLVIGTHLDQLPKSPKRDQMLQQMNGEIFQKVYSKYKRYLVLRDEHEVIFPINAMALPEEGRDTVASDIQKKVLKVANLEKASFSIPVKWLALQLDLVKQGSVLTVQQCCRRGNYLGMREKHVLSALMFFKEVGLNLYYPDSGSDLVLTELDPLINRLSALLKASFHPHPDIIVDLEEFHKKGLFDKRLLKAVISEELPNEDHSINNSELLLLLSQLKVILPIKIGESEKYFLPTALAPSDCDDPYQVSTDKEPLVATFHESMLPPGFFMMLVTQLVSNESGTLGYNPGEEITQYRNAVLLAVNESNTISGGVLSVVDKKRWIEFNFSGLASSCGTLLQIISCALDKTSEKLMSKTKIFFFRFLCLVCQSSDHTCIVLKHSSVALCSRNQLKKRELTGKDISRLCWLMETNQDNSPVVKTELCCSNVDDSLLSEEDYFAVLSAITTVNNWDGLGLALGLGTHKMDEIRRDKQDIAECRKAMLSVWTKEGKASWRRLCLALDDSVVGEKHLARKIANEHKETLQESVQQSAAPFKGNKNLKENVHEGKDCSSRAINVKDVISCVKQVFDENLTDLKFVCDRSLQTVSAEMFSAGLISNSVKDQQSFEDIISDFYNGFVFMKTIPQVEEHCKKFFSALHRLGGPFSLAGNAIKQSVLQMVDDKLGLSISLD